MSIKYLVNNSNRRNGLGKQRLKKGVIQKEGTQSTSAGTGPKSFGKRNPQFNTTLRMPERQAIFYGSRAQKGSKGPIGGGASQKGPDLLNSRRSMKRRKSWGEGRHFSGRERMAKEALLENKGPELGGLTAKRADEN